MTGYVTFMGAMGGVYGVLVGMEYCANTETDGRVMFFKKWGGGEKLS
jgi:hypothetical protein